MSSRDVHTPLTSISPVPVHDETDMLRNGSEGEQVENNGGQGRMNAHENIGEDVSEDAHRIYCPLAGQEENLIQGWED